MATFEKADGSVKQTADALIEKFECFRVIKERGVRIDFMFAYPKYNDNNEAVGVALKHHGHQALAITRKINLKDRAKGLGDVEICVDAEWWDEAREEQRASLIDHELTHIVVSGRDDDLGRPIIRLRPHDVEFGWFTSTAERHGVQAIECIEAKKLMDNLGQYYWPVIAETAEEQSETTARFNKLEVVA